MVAHDTAVTERSSGGGSGWNGSRSAAIKTSELGVYVQEPEAKLEETQREEADWDGGMTTLACQGSRPSTIMQGQPTGTR